jgi:hypothetical protein
MPAKGTKLSAEARAMISAARSIPQAKCICRNCGKEFETHQSEVARGGGIYCNRKCEGDYKKGKPMSEESNLKKSLALKGRVFTPIWKAKISAARIGKPSNRKGMSATEQQKQKQSEKMSGRKHTEEHNALIRQNTPKGEDSPHWKGGVTSLNWQIRYCWKMKAWRDAVFKRDNYCDWFSGVKGNGNLHAHHIVSFSSIMKRYDIQSLDDALKCDALWDVSNGITMIDSNHMAYHAMCKEEILVD